MTRRFPLGSLGAALALLVGLLGGCGDEEAPSAPEPDAAPREGPWVFGQEIWVKYESAAHTAPEGRYPRKQEEAKALAESLRARVTEGADVGSLARANSNAPGAPVEGFMVLDGQRPDERYSALKAIAVGEVTPILDFYGGYFFARRVAKERGVELWKRYEKEGVSARALAVAVAYKGMVPYRHEVKATKEDAIAFAQSRLNEHLNGADFGDLAKRYTNDGYSRDHGGLIYMPRPWGWSDRVTPFDGSYLVNLSPILLDVIFHAQVGVTWPKVIVTDRGIFLVQVLERVDSR